MIKLKNTKAEIPILISIGIILFTISTILLLFVYRPFVPWKKFVCSEEDGTLIFLDYKDGALHTKYVYVINNVQYEKILKVYANRKTKSFRARTIYVNKNNPNDVKAGTGGGLVLWVIIIPFMLAGSYFIFYSIKLIICKRKKAINDAL